MNNRIAHNINIANLIGALSEILHMGNTFVDVMIDDDLTIRLRGSKKEDKIREEEEGEDPLSEETDLTDFT